MEDEDVVFEGSPLYEHLVDAGFDVFECEKKSTPDVECPDLNDDNNDKSCKDVLKLEKNGWWKNLKCSFYNYVYDESWHKQVKSLHKRSCCQIIDSSLKKQILYEDDATYVESFATSLSEKVQTTSSAFSESLYGQMFLQITVLCVTIGYGFLRMFYAKSGPSNPPIAHHKLSSPPPSNTQQQQAGICCSVLIYGLDMLSLLVIVAALLPVTMKFSSVGRLVGRLEAFASSLDRFVSSIENLRRLSTRAVLFVQESEVIRRGYTLVTVPVSRLELGLNACGGRECLDLRRSIFQRNKNILTFIRRASLSVLKLFPDNVELRGVKRCLAKKPLKDFCGYLETRDHHHHQMGVDGGDDDDDNHHDGDDNDDLFKLTDGFSLASLKFLVELTNAHASELIRLLSLLSVISTNELSPCNDSGMNAKLGFSSQTSILKDLSDSIERNISPLDQCLNMAQIVRNKLAEGNEKKEERKKLDRNDGKNSIRGLHVAMHSLKLHLESALRRVQSHDEKLESLLDDDVDIKNELNHDGAEVNDLEKGKQGISTKYTNMVDDLSSEAKQLGRELKAGKECLEELEMIITKMTKKSPRPPGDDQSDKSIQKMAEDSHAEVQLILAGTEPLVEDEFFEGLSGKKKDFVILEDDQELENARLIQKDAARVMSELRSVISIRARDMEERERKAFLKKFNDLEEPLPANEADDRQSTSNGFPNEEEDPLRSSTSPEVPPNDSVNGNHSPLPHGSEANFNGARPKESTRNIRSRRDRPYFRERVESSDSDEGNVSSNHNPSKTPHLRHRRPVVMTPTSNESSGGAASMETSYSRESEDANGMNVPFGFVETFEGGNFQSPLTMKGLASLAASLSRRVNLGEEDLYGNDDDDDDDDDVVGQDEEEEEEEDEMNEVSESDLDSDDIYHVTDDDEGFDGVNVGYDDDDDDEK